MDDGLSTEIETMEREDNPGRRWQQGLAWLRELRELRAQRRVTEERVRDVVREAVGDAASTFGMYSDISATLDAITARTAKKLSGVALSAPDLSSLRFALEVLTEAIAQLDGAPLQPEYRERVEMAGQGLQALLDRTHA